MILKLLHNNLPILNLISIPLVVYITFKIGKLIQKIDDLYERISRIERKCDINCCNPARKEG